MNTDVSAIAIEADAEGTPPEVLKYVDLWFQFIGQTNDEAAIREQIDRIKQARVPLKAAVDANSSPAT
jgi:hypothetical protein